VGLTNLGSESETCVGSRVHLVGVSIYFEKNFYRLPFTPPSLVRRIGPSIGFVVYLTMARNRKCLLVSLEEVNVIVELDEKLSSNFIS
jgi:hypothetical protein